jgi:hypothetical protein
VDEYPLTATGKVKKNIIRDESNKLLKDKSKDMLPYAEFKNRAK